MKEMTDIEPIMHALKRRSETHGAIDVEEETVKIVIFALRDGLYAFRGSDVKELLPFMDISPVPGAPDFLPGVINNRGDIESVLYVNRFLKIPDSETTAQTRIAMAASAGVRSGIVLDAVLDVVDVPISAIQPALSTLDATVSELVVGSLLYRARTVVLLDVGRLFAKMVAHAESS